MKTDSSKYIDRYAQKHGLTVLEAWEHVLEVGVHRLRTLERWERGGRKPKFNKKERNK